MQKPVQRFLDRTLVRDQETCGNNRNQQAEQDHVDHDPAEQQILNAGFCEEDHKFADIMAHIVAFKEHATRQAQGIVQFGL